MHVAIYTRGPFSHYSHGAALITGPYCHTIVIVVHVVHLKLSFRGRLTSPGTHWISIPFHPTAAFNGFTAVVLVYEPKRPIVIIGSAYTYTRSGAIFYSFFETFY